MQNYTGYFAKIVIMVSAQRRGRSWGDGGNRRSYGGRFEQGSTDQIIGKFLRRFLLLFHIFSFIAYILGSFEVIFLYIFLKIIFCLFYQNSVIFLTNVKMISYVIL